MKRTGKVWPFHEYASAEAVVFNQYGMRPGVPLVAYNDKIGWHPQITKRQKITAAQMKVAVDLVKDTKGGVEVSKCPFPRHAIVLFDADNTPVASINVCFQCGDILVWPDWTGVEPNWEKMTEKQQKEMMMKAEAQMALYKVAFPKWKKLFRDDLGFGPDIEKEWRPTD